MLLEYPMSSTNDKRIQNIVLMDPKCQKIHALCHTTQLFFRALCKFPRTESGDVCQQIVLKSHFPQKFATFGCTLTFSWNIIEMQDMEHWNIGTLEHWNNKVQCFIVVKCVWVSLFVYLFWWKKMKPIFLVRALCIVVECVFCGLILLWKRVLCRSLTSIPPTKRNNQPEGERERKQKIGIIRLNADK